MRIEEGLTMERGSRQASEAVGDEQKERVIWGPKIITSSGGRWGEKDVTVSYKNEEFRVDGRVVEREEFIEALGPHLERMKKDDPVLGKLLEEN